MGDRARLYALRSLLSLLLLLLLLLLLFLNVGETFIGVERAHAHGMVDGNQALSTFGSNI